jgi:BlaI family transcriptional regulator, penicillinase repressor
MVLLALTERELDVMAVLWDSGPSTASEVQAALANQGIQLAYNTVLTVLRILEAKGSVDHLEEGRAHRFRSVIDRSEAGASALTRTLDRLFDGSAEALVAQLVQRPSLTRKDLKRLRKIIKQQLELRRRA